MRGHQLILCWQPLPAVSTASELTYGLLQRAKHPLITTSNHQHVTCHHAALFSRHQCENVDNADPL